MKKLLIVDFGSNMNYLLNIIKKFNICYEVITYNKVSLAILFDSFISGIILSDGPYNISDNIYPEISFKEIINRNIPILGISYGANLIIKNFGGKIKQINNYQGNFITEVPKNWEVFSNTSNGDILTFGNNNIKCYGLQNYKDNLETEYIIKILYNFIKICKFSINYI